MGRPKLYDDDVLARTREYRMALPEDEAVHTIEGLADYLGLSRETIYVWEKEADEDGSLLKPEFADEVERIRILQAKSLINNTLLRKFDSRLANMMLGKHGYAAKTESQISVKDMPKPLLDAIFNNDSDKEGSAAQ